MFKRYYFFIFHFKTSIHFEKIYGLAGSFFLGPSAHFCYSKREETNEKKSFVYLHCLPYSNAHRFLNTHFQRFCLATIPDGPYTMMQYAYKWNVSINNRRCPCLQTTFKLDGPPALRAQVKTVPLLLRTNWKPILVRARSTIRYSSEYDLWTTTTVYFELGSVYDHKCH